MRTRILPYATLEGFAASLKPLGEQAKTRSISLSSGTPASQTGRLMAMSLSPWFTTTTAQSVLSKRAYEMYPCPEASSFTLPLLRHAMLFLKAMRRLWNSMSTLFSCPQG